MGIHQDDHFPFQLAMSSLDSDMSTLTRPESFEPKAAGAIKKQQTFMCVCVPGVLKYLGKWVQDGTSTCY